MQEFKIFRMILEQLNKKKTINVEILMKVQKNLQNQDQDQDLCKETLKTKINMKKELL